MNISKLIESARKSSWGLWKFNFILQRGIPFNRPHNIRITEIGGDYIVSSIPYIRKNLNHIKGIHACGLATAAEFTSGLVLLMHLNAKEYRLIMESIEVKYHYQAKMQAFAKYSISRQEVERTILIPLKTEESVYVRCEIPVHDKEGNHLCTGYTNWQIKKWTKVKTKV